MEQGRDVDVDPTEEKRSESGSLSHRWRFGLTMLALYLPPLLVYLDNSIIATAIPKITDEFHSLYDVGWWLARLFYFSQDRLSRYLMANAATRLLYGKLYTVLDIKLVFIAAIMIFEVGSAICGAAPNSATLIVGRTIAGCGGAGAIAGTYMLVAYTVPLTQRPFYIAMFTVVGGLANVAGPPIGGLLTDKLSWRYCFYLNLPIGAISLLILLFVFEMPESAKHQRPRLALSQLVAQLDPWGNISVIPAIVSLLLALEWGGSTYSWNSGRIIGLFVVSGILFVVFVAVQIWQKDAATLPLRVVKQRSIWSGAWFAMFHGASNNIILIYVPLWFQAVKGTSAVQSGIYTLPQLACVVIGSLVGAACTSYLGYYIPTVLFSSCFLSIGTGLFTTFAPGTSTARWVAYQALYGLGIGSGFQGPLMAAQTVLPLIDIARGTSLIMFVQFLGGAVGIAAAQSLFAGNLFKGLRGVPDVDVQRVIAAGATGLRGKDVVPPAALNAVLSIYNSAVVSTFRVALVVSALSILGGSIMEWKNVRNKTE
ncbi:major facilitator superfamily transporter [Favolaschia claudopus]|uniref:Major facilitator superfamily transporter n=1 Tax=Favolaschia claudopus TaxID=2862362 RepID=A0AAW0C2T5_9AGAR